MILISYIKPNIIINSDKLITGRLRIYDSKKEKIASKELYNENFISIPIDIMPGNSISVEILTGGNEIKKQMLI